MSVEKRRSWLGVAMGLVTGMGNPAHAMDLDVFKTQSGVSATAAGAMLPDPAQCALGEVGEPLSLAEAVERALCNGSQTRQAWARIKSQAAAVGIAKSAYLPTVTGALQAVHDESATDVSGHPELSANYRSNVPTASASLSWVLFDFGGRSASLRNATELLTAAQADRDANLQAVFATVAKDYCVAQAADGAMTASIEIERSAKESFDAATARVNRGVAPVSDALQAHTALAQATFNRAKAEGDRRAALGVLASDMSLRPDMGLQLPVVDETVRPDPEFDESVSALITRAMREHPSVLEAQAEWRAAQAKVDQAQAEGMPSVSLVAKSSHSTQPISPAVGQPQYPASGRDWSVGVQVNIPLFEGFSRVYQVRQARAEVELQATAVDHAKNQIGLDVWTSYAALQTSTQNLGNSAQLLKLANASHAASTDRYLVGVGNILELLNAQQALAVAKRQRLQALTDWQAARLLLASRLGKLDMGSLAR